MWRSLFPHCFEKLGRWDELYRDIIEGNYIKNPAARLCTKDVSEVFVMRFARIVSTKPMFEPVRVSLGDC